ncbi:hypothetical protein E2C01_040366 [Portunus trituberculatus]|uniref:Uncharacterized protein n=1 Tax=Portunus trituberculatus TaxID=210409 RepID=A0A5B7FJI6_PORTR|nr:hypothetical protein [Portunus trituberculatus]
MGPIKSEKSLEVLPSLPYPDPALAAMVLTRYPAVVLASGTSRPFLAAGDKFPHQRPPSRPVPRVSPRPPPPRRLSAGRIGHLSLTLLRCSNNHAGHTLTLRRRGLNHASPRPTAPRQLPTRHDTRALGHRHTCRAVSISLTIAT